MNPDRSIDRIVMNLKYNVDKMTLEFGLKGVPALSPFKLSVACARLLQAKQARQQCGRGRGRGLGVYIVLCRHLASNEYTFWHSRRLMLMEPSC